MYCGAKSCRQSFLEKSTYACETVSGISARQGSPVAHFPLKCFVLSGIAWTQGPKTERGQTPERGTLLCTVILHIASLVWSLHTLSFNLSILTAYLKPAFQDFRPTWQTVKSKKPRFPGLRLP